MTRMLAMSVGFVVATLGLIWALASDDSDASGPIDQVSRATPDPMGLQPALPAIATPQPVRVAEPAPIQVRPRARPGTVVPVAPAPEAPVRVRALNAEPAAPAPAPRVVQSPEAQVTDVMRAMSLGILEELQKPAAPQADRVARVTEPVKPADPGQRYTVQPGDSLPGIAFRFFGSTVAYHAILDANRDLMTSPGDLRAGMVLRIPEP